VPERYISIVRVFVSQSGRSWPVELYYSDAGLAMEVAGRLADRGVDATVEGTRLDAVSPEKALNVFEDAQIDEMIKRAPEESE
jgi:hypothetical protein